VTRPSALTIATARGAANICLMLRCAVLFIAVVTTAPRRRTTAQSPGRC
jgi:hypothetical protein